MESELDLTVAGPHLAAQAIRAGLVDKYQLYVGVDLELLDERRLGNGLVFLRYGLDEQLP